jgi:hypothetical protein
MQTNKIHHCSILFHFLQHLLHVHLSSPRAHLQEDSCNKYTYGMIYVYMYGTPWFIKSSSKIRPHPLKSTYPPHTRTHNILCALLILSSLRCSNLFITFIFFRFDLRVMGLKISISANHGLLSTLFSPAYLYMTYYHIMLQI